MGEGLVKHPIPPVFKKTLFLRKGLYTVFFILIKEDLLFNLKTGSTLLKEVFVASFQ